MKKFRISLQTKEAGISAEKPALNLSKIFIGLIIKKMRQQQVLIGNGVIEVFYSGDFLDVV